MSSLLNATEKKVAEFLLTGGDLTRPAGGEIILLSAMPNEAGAGAVELSGDGYAPIAVTFDTDLFDRTGGVLTLADDQDTPNATDDWAPIVGWGIRADGVLELADFTRVAGVPTPVSVTSGNPFTLLAGTTVTFDGTAATSYLKAALADHMYRGVPMTQPTEHAIRAYTTAASAASAGTPQVAAGYGDIINPATDTWWAVGDTGGFASALDLTYAEAAASWPQTVAVDVLDQDDNRLLFFNGAGKATAEGNTLYIPAGSLAGEVM